MPEEKTLPDNSCLNTSNITKKSSQPSAQSVKAEKFQCCLALLRKD